MGLVQSTLRARLDEDDDEMVFMVPAHLTLSINQMNVMLTAGQQPGVPFRLAASGAERPQGIRKKVKYAENLVSLHKHTIKLTKVEASSSSSRRGDYSLEFVYDSFVPSVVKIFVGTREVPCYKAQGGINLRDTVTILGPFSLPEGRNRTWSSIKNETCVISWKQLLRHRAVQYKRQTQSGQYPNLSISLSLTHSIYLSYFVFIASPLTRYLSPTSSSYISSTPPPLTCDVIRTISSITWSGSTSSP